MNPEQLLYSLTAALLTKTAAGPGSGPQPPSRRDLIKERKRLLRELEYAKGRKTLDKLRDKIRRVDNPDLADHIQGAVKKVRKAVGKGYKAIGGVAGAATAPFRAVRAAAGSEVVRDAAKPIRALGRTVGEAARDKFVKPLAEGAARRSAAAVAGAGNALAEGASSLFKRLRGAGAAPPPSRMQQLLSKVKHPAAAAALGAAGTGVGLAGLRKLLQRSPQQKFLESKGYE